MAKKDKKGTKAAETADKASRWTVRGVQARLQKAAGDAARARGQTLGQWLSGVVEAAVLDVPEAPAAAAGWREAMEARVARLETQLSHAVERPADAETGPARRRARRPGADAAEGAAPTAV